MTETHPTDDAASDLPKTDPRTGEPLQPATPAATIIIFRDAGDTAARQQGCELLMVERSAKMAFAAGAAVFPGGRVDPGDWRLAERLWDGDTDEGDADEGASRVAAIRETLEETGMAIGFSHDLDGAALGKVRDALHAQEPFDAICDAHGWQLDLSVLTPFTRWRPPFNEARVFDTRFYLAKAPAKHGELKVDATENQSLFWASAQTVLDRADADDLKIIFPTRRNLERLAQFPSHDAAVAHAQSYPVRMVVPFIEPRNGEPHLCIADDLGYPVTSEPMKGAMRG